MKSLLLSTASLLLATGIAAQTTTPEPSDTLSMPGYELDELVIEGERPVMQSDGAKLTYNVAEDPGADSSSALDILKKVPQVSVDGDGKIRLNGSTAFKFQINGLENPMLKQYADQILQAMPASSIVKIEVITEPGAKEDAEGTAGIINIITEQSKSSDGYSGTASLRVDNRSVTPSLYGIMKKDKVTLSARVNYQNSFSPQKGENLSTAEYLTGDRKGSLTTLTGQRAMHNFVGGNLNMSWEPNDHNLFTMGADLFYIGANLKSLYGSSSRFDPAGNLLWSFGQDGSGPLRILNVSANASFRHSFGHDGNYLVLSYLFNYGRYMLGIDRWYTDRYNYTPEYEAEYQQTKQFDRGHTVQADYSNDFNSEHHKMEVGVKGVFRHNTALSNYAYGDSKASLMDFPELNTNILQPQNIYAAYASYTGTFNPLTVVAGLRYEHTLMGITDRYNARADFRNRLNDVVPNAALTWNFSQMSNLRLAYQMRISRPSINQVNPFSLSFSPYELNSGNPDLTSEHSHIVSLKYSGFGRVVGGSAGIEYNLTDDAISSYIYMMQIDGRNVIVNSYANIGRKQNVALTGFFNWNIIPHMSLSLNGRLAYNMLSAPSEGYRHNGWSGNIGANWNYAVADVWKFSAYGAWFSRNISVQGYSSGYYYYGLSAARDFLADKSLTLSLSANNFLASSMSFKGYTATREVIYHTNSRSLSAWSVGLSISWKFGKLNAKVKETGINVGNDDINQSSTKGSAGTI